MSAVAMFCIGALCGMIPTAIFYDRSWRQSERRLRVSPLDATKWNVLAQKAAAATTAFPPPNTLPPLTDRQVEVLGLAAGGLSNQAIADQLGVTLQTVKFHLSNVYVTLGAKNRTGAVSKARELGVLA